MQIKQFITSVKNDKRLNDLKTVIVGSTIVKKSDHCKHLGVTIDKHLGSQTQVKKVLKNMAVGIKTVETVQHRFPTQVLLMLFHALVMSHLDYSLLFFFKISSYLLLSLEKLLIVFLLYFTEVELTTAAYARSKCEPHVFKSRSKIHLEKESNAVPIQVASTWRDFASNKPVSFFLKIVGEIRVNYLCLHKSFILFVW